MSLVTTLRAGIAALKGTLAGGGLLVTVQRQAYAGVGLNGRDTWSAAVAVPNVLFEDAEGTKVRFEGDDVIVRGKLTIFDPTLVVSRKDRFIVPDGRTLEAAMVRPNVIPADGGRLVTEVLLG